MRWVLDVITVLGFLLTILGTYLTVRSGSSYKILHDELIFYGSIITFSSVLGWFHWFRKYHIAKSVFNGRSSINEAHIKALEFSKMWSKNKYSITECISEYSGICQLIAKGLRKFHSSEISITVKYVNSEEEVEGANYASSLYVKDLCRDVESQPNRTLKASLSKDVIDYISENTDFNYIYNIMDRRPIEDVYFFSNCLPCFIGYKNTHIHADWNSWWKRTVSFVTLGQCYWKLPYKSTIIVPISSNSEQGSEYIEGFLCADSSRPFVFSKKYDLIIMQDIARALYPMTQLINQKHLVSNKKLSND